MPVLTADQAQRLLADRHRGVFVTLKRSDGRPQLSNVTYALLDGRIRVSVIRTRAKVGNARRDPRVSLHVTTDDFSSYVIAEGDAELSSVARDPGDATCQALLRIYEAARGRHPDPGDFHRAMVADERLELSFVPRRLYPLAGGQQG